MEGTRRKGAVKPGSEDGRPGCEGRRSWTPTSLRTTPWNAISFAQGALEEAEAAALDAVYARAKAIALSSGIARQ